MSAIRLALQEEIQRLYPELQSLQERTYLSPKEEAEALALMLRLEALGRALQAIEEGSWDPLLLAVVKENQHVGSKQPN